MNINTQPSQKNRNLFQRLGGGIIKTIVCCRNINTSPAKQPASPATQPASPTAQPVLPTAQPAVSPPNSSRTTPNSSSEDTIFHSV